MNRCGFWAVVVFLLASSASAVPQADLLALSEGKAKCGRFTCSDERLNCTLDAADGGPWPLAPSEGRTSAITVRALEFVRAVYRRWYATGDLVGLRSQHDVLKAMFDSFEERIGADGRIAGCGLAAEDAALYGLLLMAYEEGSVLARLTDDEAWFMRCRATIRKLRTVSVDPRGSKPAAAVLALAGLKNAKETYRDVLAHVDARDILASRGEVVLEAMSVAGETARAIEAVRTAGGGKLAPAAWLIRRVLGIEVLEPGARCVRVQPELGSLDWAEGELPVPGGAVGVRAVRKADGSCETTVSAPDGVRVVRDETAAIQAEIDRTAPGGEVRIPAGRHDIKSLTLHSNMTLRLMENAVLSSSRLASDFVVIPEEGPLRSNPAVIQLFAATNVTIVGERGSAIDGNDAYDPQGEETYRGPHGILACDSHGVTVRGLEMRNIGNWATRFLDSADLVFEDLRFRGGHDGVHVRGCDRVRVSRCSIRTGDDCVAGFGNEDVLIEDCEFNTACSALRFSGRHVRVNRCRAFAPSEYPIRNSTSIPKRVLGEDVKGTGRHTMHSFYTYHSEETRHARFDPCDIVITDCEAVGVERFFHYNMSGNEIWQKGRPLLDITFRRVKGERLGMSLCAYGKADAPLALTIEDASFSFAEPQRELIRGAFIRELDVRNVRVRDVDGPCLRSWGGETELKADDLKGAASAVEKDPTPFYTHHV